MQEGYRFLFLERRFDYRVTFTLGIPAALLAGFVWAAAFGAVFGLTNYYLVAKTESRSKQHIADLFGGQIRTVWLLVDGMEIETPIKALRSRKVEQYHLRKG